MPRGSNFQGAFTNERANEIFERNHGAEMRAYYAKYPPRTGSAWTATEDALIGRGANRRTPAARGCE
jgi:hypothetical protein